VIRAIRDTAHGCIGLCYFEWASGNSQRVLVPWTLVQSIEDGERIAMTLDRASRPFEGSTDLGAAIRFAVSLLACSPFLDHRAGHRRLGRRPAERRRRAALCRARSCGGARHRHQRADHQRRVCDVPGQPTLTQYYEEQVIGGAKAFVIDADRWEVFGAALISKLRREIA
jgi:hypothetical protein